VSAVDAYVTLIAGLPSPESLHQARQPPLSRLKLERRLKALTPEDARVLQAVEDAIDWRRFDLATTEQQVIARGHRALSLVTSDSLRKIIRDRLELRTFLAALRRRFRGEAAPSSGTRWGFGRWVSHIERNWSDPGFRLDTPHPWIRDADRMIREGDATTLERLLLERSYRSLQRYSATHVFDLEAVVIYVLKWNIVDRATRYNRVAATNRFAELIESGLGEYSILDFAEVQ
jgi:hypothetical protein